MLGLLLVAAAFILGLIADVGAVVSWYKGHDHSAIGWLFIAIVCSAIVSGFIANLRRRI